VPAYRLQVQQAAMVFDLGMPLTSQLEQAEREALALRGGGYRRLLWLQDKQR
jgi:hypothetical protein